MSERLKRILFIAGFLGIIVVVAYAIYAVFFRSPSQVITTPPSVEEEPGGTSGLPGAGEGSPTRPTSPTTGTTDLPVAEVADGGITQTERLTASEIMAATLAGDGSGVNYYDPDDGKFYTVNSDGEISPLSDATFPDAETIVLDEAADTVVIEFPDGSNIIYDFESEDQTTLPAHWEEFDFSSTGTEVIAKSIGNDPNARALVVTSTDGSKTQVIAALGDNADLVDVAWSPNDQVVAFSNTGGSQSGFGRNMILPIGKNDENFKGLVVEGLAFHAIWSPDGARILYDVTGPTSSYRPLLWIVDGTPKTMGDDRRSLGLNTWVEKCTFADASTIYCAVPQYLPENAGLQPAINTIQDSIYRIDVDSGKVRLIGEPEDRTQMSNLAVSADGRYLYYTDEDGRLQQMRLK